MKVEVKEGNELQFLPYPKLMISESKLLVLFLEETKGVLISDPNKLYRNTGIHYSDEWVMTSFTDFKGSITITQ